MKKLDEIWRLLPQEISEYVRGRKQGRDERLQEIRLRAERPVFIKTDGGKYFLDHVVTQRQLKQTVERIGGYSLYAFEEELKQGYITVYGGHRVGFCGRGVIEGGRVKTLRHISSLNIRIASEIKGCADKLMPYLFADGRPCHTLIVSPPGWGKTTLLRDVIRSLSYGGESFPSFNVGVVDERGELCAMEEGIPQTDVGPSTDVQENCPKAEGMYFLLRSMAPEVICVDELGGNEDIDAVIKMFNAGVTVISTLHGSGMEEIVRKNGVRRMLDEMGERGRIIFLSREEGTGTVEEIWDGEGNRLFKRSESEKC